MNEQARQGEMLMRGRIVFCCAILAFASAAPARADSGPFAFVRVAESSSDFDGILALVSGDEMSLEAGIGYRFNAYFSVQAGYQDFGEYRSGTSCPPGAFCPVPPECPPDAICFIDGSTGSAFEAEVSGWSVRTTGTLPLGGSLAAFASVGALVYDADLSIRTPELTFDIDQTEDELVYEAGLRLQLTEWWAIEASYERVNLDIDSTKVGFMFLF